MLGPPLTPRESAVLAAVERRLTNPEIASELFISVRTVESHIASLRRKLGAESRADLVSAARELRDASVRVPANPFRGRGRDVAELEAAVRAGDLLTLVGPGGVGKTRLALEFAKAQDARTPVIVEFEHATPGDVVNRISRVLGLEASPHEDLLASVGIALAAQPYLLVLDNADHVGPATRSMIARLRPLAPGLKVLVTSQTPLGGDDEHVHLVPPLTADGVDAPASALLRDRLSAHGHAPAAQDDPFVDHIATRLDGLPLALELAASAARHLPLAELSARLDRDFAMLDRATPEGRHRSLETAFEWTWHLLDDEERDVLQRLAALPRTFDIDLAVAVSHEGAERIVLRLLDRSLLVPAFGDGGRWRLLAVMREFVLARTDPDVVRDVLRRHAEMVTIVSEGFIARARTDASKEAMGLSVMLCPEVNAALRWSLAERDPVAVRLSALLAVGVEQYGSDADSVEALSLGAHDDWLLERATPSQLLVLGNALAFFDIEVVSRLAERALAAADPADPHELRAAHQLAGLAAAYGSDPAAALPHLDTAERLAIEHDDPWDAAAARQFRGVALRSIAVQEGRRSDVADAVEAFEGAMRAYARAGDETHVNNVRFMMALTAAESGYDSERAARWAAECVAYSESTDNEHELAHGRLVQATLGLDESGELGELLVSFRHLGDLRCVHRVLMLRANRAADPRSRVAALREASAIATAAGDRARQIATVEGLVRAHRDAGDDGAVLAALDTLADLAGRSAAVAACPPGQLGAFLGESART
ncbi:ATP-binding protein [Microbacterium gallinarum]|uniref:AAA family ATPase n=1 Tax=Microbacterium gallinarum TaxID=2762209 RepID=A0ABR8X6H0_9MICO|nr:LuxR C-terminal-related transcriptional regulator [Microbacterium gallinarum]MBD8024808.1 AAA family ATPase [Microbacterium gallinarum]